MAEPATKLPINTEAAPAIQPTKAPDWQPFDTLRNQIDRLFHDFQTGSSDAVTVRPRHRAVLASQFGFNVTPAMDIVEKEKASRSQPSFRASMPRTSTFSFLTKS